MRLTAILCIIVLAIAGNFLAAVSCIPPSQIMEDADLRAPATYYSTPPVISMPETIIEETSPETQHVTPNPLSTVSPATTGSIAKPIETRDFKIVGYITHWHIDKLSSTNLKGLTHLIWQGIKVTGSEDPSLYIPDNSGWWQVSDAVKAGHANGAKVLVSLMGQWDETDLTDVLKSSTQRSKLIENLKDIVESYNLDGVDIDNENKDCDEYINSVFIKELYDVLNPLGKTITMAGNPYRVCINSDVYDYVDFINVMTYDMASGKGFPYHSTLEESIQAIELWAGNAMPKEKILIGIPFYGRDGGVSFYEYWRIVEKYHPSPEQNEVSEPSASGGVIWWNGPDLVKEKVTYVISNRFGGVMMYEIGTDSRNSSSLLESVYRAKNQLIDASKRRP